MQTWQQVSEYPRTYVFLSLAVKNFTSSLIEAHVGKIQAIGGFTASWPFQIFPTNENLKS